MHEMKKKTRQGNPVEPASRRGPHADAGKKEMLPLRINIFLPLVFPEIVVEDFVPYSIICRQA